MPFCFQAENLQSPYLYSRLSFLLSCSLPYSKLLFPVLSEAVDAIKVSSILLIVSVLSFVHLPIYFFVILDLKTNPKAVAVKPNTGQCDLAMLASLVFSNPTAFVRKYPFASFFLISDSHFFYYSPSAFLTPICRVYTEDFKNETQ